MVSRLLAVAAAAALVAPVFVPAGQVHAATLSIDMPGCTSVALSGQPPNYTLTCTPVAQLCSMTSTAATPSVGTPVTLTVGCVPPATSLTWEASRGCNSPVPVAGNPMQAIVAQAAAINCVYSATAATSGITSSTTVSWGAQVGGGITAPSGCAIGVTPSASLSSAGGQINLSGTCSGGGAVTKWTWRRDATNNVSAAQNFNDTLAANTNQAARTYTYGVVACAGPNQDVCAAEVTRTVQVAGAGAGGTGLCAQYPSVMTVDLPWGGTFTTGSVPPGLIPGTVFVGRLTVPANATSSGNPLNFGLVAASEYQGAPYTRLMTLSTQACDFRGYNPPVFPWVWPTPDPTGVNGPLAWGGNSISPGIAYLLAGTSPGSPPKPLLTPGSIYYINMRTINVEQGIEACTQSACDVRFNVSTPY